MGQDPDPGPGHRGPSVLLIVVAMTVLLAGAAVLTLRFTGGDEPPAGDRVQALPAADDGATDGDADRTTTPTTVDPAPTSTAAPTTTVPLVPVEQLPVHEAVYRDGKLVLQGTVPTAEVSDRIRAEAAAVIGAENVIVRHQIDARVPAPTDGRVRVDEAFLFARGSYEIDPSNGELLALGETVMTLNPQARMRIIGFTDDSGTPEANQALSQLRAQALVDHFVSRGIARERFEAIGRGPADPVAPNDTEENRSRNRRIEVELVGLLAE